MDLRSIHIKEIDKSQIANYFRPRHFNERTILARIVSSPQVSSYREIVNYFLQDENAYSLCVASRPKPIIFYKQSFPASRKKELITYVASWAEEDHIKINHIFMDLRKKDEYTDDFLTIYFSENKKTGTFEDASVEQEKIFIVSKLIVPRTFAHCFTLEDNLKEKMNFYSKIEASYLHDYKESALNKFEGLFKAG